MPNKTKQNLLSKAGSGFTMVEVVAATLILSITLSSVMFLVNRYLNAVVDMRLQQKAFEVARANMETLLSSNEVSDMSESGQSEEYPDIFWDTVVEPFYLPVKERMWIRALCSANYTDSDGQFQKVELEHWITSLTAAQIKQILSQQDVMGEYYDLVKEGYMTDTQQATLAYLQQQGLDFQAYQDLVEEHRRLKLEWLQGHQKNFKQSEFDKYIEELEEEETEVLEDLGMDFDDYNTNFVPYYEPPVSADSPNDTYEPDSDSTDPDSLKDEDDEVQQEEEYQWDWDNIPKELWGLIEKLTGAQPPY